MYPRNLNLFPQSKGYAVVSFLRYSMEVVDEKRRVGRRHLTKKNPTQCKQKGGLRHKTLLRDIGVCQFRA